MYDAVLETLLHNQLYSHCSLQTAELYVHEYVKYFDM